MRPRNGRGSRSTRRVWPRRKAARMLLRALLLPDGFGGCLPRTRLWGGRMSGAAAAYEANGQRAKDVTFRLYTWLLRDWRCCLRMKPPGRMGVSGGCNLQTRPWDGHAGYRLRGRNCADGSGGRGARKHLLTFGFSIKGAVLCHNILCVSSVLFSFLSKLFLRHYRIFFWTPNRGSSARQTRKTYLNLIKLG